MSDSHTATAAPPDGAVEPAAEQTVRVHGAEFPAMSPASAPSPPRPISRFYDVKVTVCGELGRVDLPLNELLKLGVGSVVELNRSVQEPVDLLADGVLLARGEIVVVDDCYGIRITDVSPDPQGARPGPGG